MNQSDLDLQTAISIDDLVDPTVVVLVAPSGVGKTAFLAALLQLSKRASCVTHSGRFHVTPPTPLIGTLPDAALHLANVHERIAKGDNSKRTPRTGVFSLAITALRGASENTSRDLLVVDTLGADLFPEAMDTGHQPMQFEDRLAQVLSEHRVDTHRVSVLAFLNEPAGHLPSALSQGVVPKRLADFLDGTRLSRLIFFVGCADTMFPQGADLAAGLRSLNAQGRNTGSFEAFYLRFRGSPHLQYACDLIGHLDATRQLDANHDIGLFWGSALGTLPESGRANKEVKETGQTVLRDVSVWNPAGVLEPLLFATGLTDDGGNWNA